MQSETRPAAAATAEVAVRGTGTPVLVVHGTPGGIDVADIMARFLPSSDFRVVTLSRPGYLGTALAGPHATLDDEADLYAAVLDDLGIERAAVLAWSGGGPAAYRFAARHPDRVRSLAVAAGLTGRWAPPSVSLPERLVGGSALGAALARAAARLLPATVVRLAVSGVSSLRDQALRDHVRGILGDPERRAFVLDLARTGNTSGPHRAGWDADVRNLGAVHDLGLTTVQAPTLLVHGSADTDVEPTHSLRALAEVPHAELMTLPGGTHFALWDHPDARSAQQRVREHLAGRA